MQNENNEFKRPELSIEKKETQILAKPCLDQ